MKISYSFGMVDLMHYGHILALKKAAEDADLKIFGLVSDAAANAWVGSLASNEMEREEVLKSVRYIDIVMRQETFDPTSNLKQIHIKYPHAVITLFHGNDWKVIPAQRYIESIGGKAITLNYYERLSPMRIIESLTADDGGKNRILTNLISTKANTLQILKEKLKKSIIEKLYVFTVKEFISDPNLILANIQSQFLGGKIVVRSSSEREDAFENSNAGHFDSVLDVDAKDKGAVIAAIKQVMASYGAFEEIAVDEQILVQSQTKNVLISGVVFTRDIQRNRPYYVINYDESGKTNTVTSGAAGMTAWMIHTISGDSIPEKWKTLMEAVREIEDTLSGMFLDIEFAITADRVVIFQVRPLAAAYKFGRKTGEGDIERARQRAIDKYNHYRNKGIMCYSDMAFWNPAEIIGDNPYNLDYSLYRQIITRHAWNDGIAALGYRRVADELMYRFGNKPYINVEYSFEALTPAAISDNMAKKLKRYYTEKLKKDLTAHDKIEFEIVYNCFDFSLESRIQELSKNDFSMEEVDMLKDVLRQITTNIISNYTNILDRDLNDIRILESIRLDVQNITKDCEDFCLIAKAVHTLLDAVSKYGTPQFSRQARCAFIAKSLSKSLVDAGYISSNDYHRFLLSIQTVATNYDRDYHLFLEGKLSKNKFRSLYGHLRAGTYNIRSFRYDEFDYSASYVTDRAKISDMVARENKTGDKQSDLVMESAIKKALADTNWEGVSSSEILFFIKKAIEEREYFKFIFTKSLSFALELIKNMGQAVGISIDDLSYLELPEVFAAEYYSDISRLHEFWELIIEKRKELHKLNSELILPSVICSAADFDYIENLEARPNYITEKEITAEIIVLNGEDMHAELQGKIVVIDKADPGYDWIFAKGIVGLITKYGGAASHMAIRCAEFGVPAAIGCGTRLYDYVVKADSVLLDCRHEKIICETGANKDHGGII